MDFRNEILTTAIYLLRQIPLFLVWIVGLILALNHWSNYPKVAKLATTAFALLIVQTLIFTVINMVLPRFYADTSIAFYYSIVGVVQTLFSTLAWGLIVAAIFTQRYKK